MQKVDYYKTLGLDRFATGSDIRKAYRKLAKKHHPDVVTEKDDSQIKAINEAYAVLSDASERRTYDLTHPYAGMVGGGGSSGHGQYHDPRPGARWDPRRVANAARKATERGASASPPDSSSGTGQEGGQAGWSQDQFGYKYDWEEWNRMHFGPSKDDLRAQFYQQWSDARASGWKGVWEDPTLSDRTNFYARRRAKQYFTARGMSETHHYREYAERFRLKRAAQETKWPLAVAFWGSLGFGIWLASSKLNR